MSSHETPLTYDRREPYFERSNYTHGILHVFLGLLGLCTFIGLKGKNQISKGELPFKLVYVSSRRWKQSGFHRGGYDGLDRGAIY